MDISNIFLLYDGDGSPESPFLVPIVVFAGVIVVLMVVLFTILVTPVVVLMVVLFTILVTPVVLAGTVGATKQLQIKNNNIIIKDEVVQKLNNPDSNYASVMAPVTQQPCVIIKFYSSQWKQGVGKYS